jgi:hypothetical protein
VVIVALLSWYDERPEWLYELAVSLGEHGITHLAALDGAYASLPGGQAESPRAQRDALWEGAKAARVGVTLGAIRPTTWSSEMAKRAELFNLGRSVFEMYGPTPGPHNHGDWFYIIDADEYVAASPSSIQDELALAAANGYLAVEVPVYTPTFVVRGTDPKKYGGGYYRKFFRALPDLTCRGRHYTYTSPSAGLLWGQPHQRLVPSTTIEDFVVIHRNRPHDARRVQQTQYYRERDLAGVEYDACDEPNCGTPAARVFPDGHITCRKHAHLYAQRTGMRDTARR